MELSPGKQLGPYKILSTLGSGGMGEVYRAQDSRLDRIVALKILPIDVAEDEERMLRFEREAKAASKLSHPNVAHIYEIGSSENIRFIAMECVEGLTLDERIKTRQLEITEIIDIGMQIADALDEAHHKGIMHRDIKPANVMIKEKGQVKVLDFGLAKIFRTAGDAAASEINTLKKTRSGTVFGTVPYMSPEQALGRKVDLRSDIFSLGAVLYEMTTGKLPFSGAGPGEVLDNIIHTQPDAISRFNYNVPPELERIIRKCLEKDADRRYQSSRDLFVDLKNLKRDSDAGIVVRQRPVLVMPRSRFIAIAGAALVLTIAIAAGLLWHARSRQTIHSIAVMPFLNVAGNPDTEYLGDGITESTINALSQLPQLKVMAPGTVFTYKGKNVDPRKVGRDLKVDAIVTGKIQHRGDTLIIEANLASVEDGSLIWGEQFQRTLSDLTTLQSDISNELTEKLQLKLTGQQKILITKRYTDNSDAYRLYLKGRYFFNKRTEEGLKKGIEFFNQAIEKDPNYARAYAGLSQIYSLLEDHAKSKAAAIRALQLDDDLAEAHVSMAFVKGFEWDFDGEEQEYKKAIQLNPNLADAHFQYGDLLAAKGQMEKALFETKMAQQLDPLNVHISTHVGI
jgi:TolB-like protein